MAQIKFKGPKAVPCGGQDSIAEDCKKVKNIYGEGTPCETCKKIIRAKVIAGIESDPDYFEDLVDGPPRRYNSKGEEVDYNPEMLSLQRIVEDREPDAWFQRATALDAILYSSGTVAVPADTHVTIVRRGFRFFVYLGEYQTDHKNEFVWSTSDTDWLRNNLAF